MFKFYGGRTYPQRDRQDCWQVLGFLSPTLPLTRSVSLLRSSCLIANVVFVYASKDYHIDVGISCPEFECVIVSFRISQEDKGKHFNTLPAVEEMEEQMICMNSLGVTTRIASPS